MREQDHGQFVSFPVSHSRYGPFFSAWTKTMHPGLTGTKSPRGVCSDIGLRLAPISWYVVQISGRDSYLVAHDSRAQHSLSFPVRCDHYRQP